MDKKELNKLIEEILLKEFKVKIGDWKTTGDKYQAASIRDAGFDYSKVKNKRDIDKIKQMAALDGESDYLEPEDITAASTTSGLKLYARDWAKAAPATTPPAGRPLPPPRRPPPPAPSTKSFDDLIKDTSSNRNDVLQAMKDEKTKAAAIADVEPRLVAIAKIVQGYIDSDYRNANDRDLKILRTAFAKDMELVDFLAKMGSPTKEKIQRYLDSTGALKQKTPSFGGFGSSMAGQEIKPGTNWEDISALTVEKQEDLVNFYGAVRGENYRDKFKSLEGFSKAVMESYKAKNVQKIKDFAAAQKPPLNQSDIMAYAFVMSILADTAKRGETSNAGNLLEGFLSYFILQPAAGGSGAAVDNIGKILNGNQVYTSAKFYRNLEMKQSTASLTEQTAQFGQVYYFALVKSVGRALGKGAEYNNLQLIVLKLEMDGDKLFATNIRPDLSAGKKWRLWSKKDLDEANASVKKTDGTVDHSKVKPTSLKNALKKNKKTKIPTQTFLMKEYTGKFAKNLKGNIAPEYDAQTPEPFAQIGALPDTFKNASDLKRQFDEIFINTVASNASSTQNLLPIVGRISENLRDIQSMEDETKSLVGVTTNDPDARTLGTNTKKEIAEKIAVKIARLHGDIKAAFNIVFGKTQGLDLGVTLSESKSPLDQLIEEIIKEKLLK